MIGEKAKQVAGVKYICTGLKDGIKGSINAIKFLWKQMEFEDELELLLINMND